MERRQTQQRELSGCGVAQWGQRQTGMARIVAASAPAVEAILRAIERLMSGRRLLGDGQDLAVGDGAARRSSTRTVARPAARRRALGMVVVNVATPLPFVRISPETIASRPGTLTVNRAVAPASRAAVGARDGHA